MMVKKKWCIIGLTLVVFLMLVMSVSAIERGSYWNKIDNLDGSYNLKIYNTLINYYNGSDYQPIIYGSCGSNCFRDWNSLIYRKSPNGTYINLYDVNDNYVSSFGFGITGSVGGTTYKYSTLNFTWIWSSEQNATTNEYIFKAWNNRTNFNWTQEYHFYPNQSMKIKNTVTNNLGANITNTKFWYIQTIRGGDGVWFNGTKYTEDTYKTGEFDSLLPQVKFEDYYVFEYDDLLGNGFNITDFYLGNGSVIGVNSIRILGIGITKGSGVFPNGVSVIVDPSVKIGGSEGGADVYVREDKPNTNYGSDSYLLVKGSSSKRDSYLTFNISSIPNNQKIDNASLCLYLYQDQGSQTIGTYHVYSDWQENIITWNNQPCGTNFDNFSSCNLTAESNVTTDSSGSDGTWECWGVVNMVREEYNQSDNKVSIALHTADLGNADEFFSKEYSNSSLWSYLNITYSLKDIVAPNITITSPKNSSYNNQTILINISAQDPNLDSVWWYNGSDNLSYTNETYYTFSQRSNTIIAYANDSLGNLNQTNVTFFIDSVAPSISIVLPQDGASYGYNESLALNFSVSDNNLDSCWYKVVNSTGQIQINNLTLTNCQNTTFNVSGNGSYEIKIYANDSSGNEGFSSVNFSVQIGAPTITLRFPIDVYLNYNKIEFNYTTSDVDLESCELWGDFTGEFKLNQTNINPINNTINSFNLNLSDGSYLWNIRCNDSQGNFAVDGNKSFYVDTIFPGIIISEPSGTKNSRTGIPLSFFVIDNNSDSCWYNVYRGASPEITNNSINCNESTSFNVSSDGNFVLNLYANDSAGNLNQSSLSFSVDTGELPSPPTGGGGGGGGGSALPMNQTGKLEVSKIGGVITREGDKKTLSVNVKNIGKIFLNNCKLKIIGGISSWIYSSQIGGIAPGENIDFVFDVNVPEEIESGDYSGELEVNCDEARDSQNIKVSIPKGLNQIGIREIKHEKQGLNISYIFDNSNFIGEYASVEIWLVDEDGVEIKRVTDTFNINKDGLIERSVLMEIPDDLAGIYSVYFALSSDLDNYVRKSVVLGRSSTTGLAILDNQRNKMIGYIVFLIIIATGIFFIWRNYGKKTDGKNAKKERFKDEAFFVKEN